MDSTLRRAWAVLGTLALIGPTGGARACDTPVYAYTMQMWSVDPYRVLYFHGGQEDPADREVNLLLAEAAQDPRGETNISFQSVDASSLEGGSGLAATAWRRNASRKTPFHVVVSPRGVDIAAERLTPASARALFHSPKRRQLADLLCEGKMGVMVLLLGSNEAENASAQAAVQAAREEARQSGADVGLLEVKRADAGEKWFVRQMLAVEDDLNELNHPMLFGVFGRGHVLEPFVGRGISQGNVLDLIAFMGGPCSCEVKAAAPGTDLLVTCDWSRAVFAEGAPAPGLGYAEIPYEEVPAAPIEETAPQPIDTPTKAPAAASAPTGAAKVAATPAAAPKSAAPTARATPSSAAPKASPRPPAARPAERPRGRGGDVARRGPNLHPPATTAGPAQPPALGPGQPAQVTPAPGPPKAAETDPARGPELPAASEAAATATAPPEKPFAARLGLPIGIAVGGLTFGVVLGGLALLWVRREQA